MKISDLRPGLTAEYAESAEKKIIYDFEQFTSGYFAVSAVILLVFPVANANRKFSFSTTDCTDTQGMNLRRFTLIRLGLECLSGDFEHSGGWVGAG